MKRDLQTLYNQEYDIVIIGGGVHGLCTAWDASLRGFRVALVEKSDFGHATSSGSFKIIHGGLRYLQHLGFRRMRISILERRRMMHMAPHLVHPLKFILPCYGHGMKGPEIMRFALLLNDIISCDRNTLADSQKQIPKGKILSREACIEQAPYISPEGLTGGAVFYDAQMFNSERLTLSFALSAVAEGAQLANYVEATGLLRKREKVVGVKVKDQRTDETFELRSKLVVNMSGPWSNTMIQRLNPHVSRQPTKLSKGIQILTRPLTDNTAFTVNSPQKDASTTVSRGNRLYFVTPWHDHSFIGTTDELYESDPDHFVITEKDLELFLQALNRALPSIQLKREDVLYWSGGLRPAGESDILNTSTADHTYRIIDHQKVDGIEGFLSAVGVKYTTCRFLAEQVVNLISKKLKGSVRFCKTAERRLEGGNIDDFNGFMNQTLQETELDLKHTRRLVYHYGSKFSEVSKYCQEIKGAQAETLNLPSDLEEKQMTVLPAEIIYAVRKEMALTLADVVLRRTGLGALGHPGQALLEFCGSIMGQELGWDEEKIQSEIAETEKRFHLPSS
ncbi:MAG: FAD-dependent oxidoreductase [Kiritimatiellae bacterium]|nr:FAD-dependent oxidoreductase [Kiritimatiellia bacterium]